jgi:glycosyltransferase involved in cell wall biosynthesis
MKSIYKILLVTDHHELKLGGAEKYFFTLKSALEKQANIEVFSLGFGPEEKIDNNTIILKETSNSFLQRYWWRLFFNPYKYYQLRSVLKRIKPDVVHLHKVKKYTISVMKAVQEYPVVRTVHDFGNMCPTGWNLHEDLQPCATGISVQCGWRHKRNLNPLVFLGRVLGLLRFNALQKKVVKKYIAPSPQLAAYLEKNNFKPTYHLPPFRANDLPVTFANLEMRHFLYVGQLMPHKGVGKLIDEFALACRSNAKLVLKIVGKGDCEAELKAKVKLLGLEENIFS